MYLTHPATNFTLGWDGLTVVTLTMSKSYAGRLCGLCGDVGVEYNEVEDPQSHGASYEVDRLVTVPGDVTNPSLIRHYSC